VGLFLWIFWEGFLIFLTGRHKNIVIFGFGYIKREGKMERRGEKGMEKRKN
jgi:hypothetical protein